LSPILLQSDNFLLTFCLKGFEMIHRDILKNNYRITTIVTLLTALGLLANIWGMISVPMSFQQSFFLLAFSVVALITLFLTKRSFMVFYLISTFAVIAAWRLSALAHLWISAWIFTFVMLLKFLNYIVLAYRSIRYIKNTNASRHPINCYEWQLLFIRLFIGFDLIPHFCEKLFAGDLIRGLDVTSFTNLHVPHAQAMVIMAGFIELGGAFSVSCGFMTRLGSIALSIYLMVATYLGGHFLDGFIWASPGGGWEYPVFWTTLILSFAVFGGGGFSIDRWLKDHYNVPMWIRALMGGAPHHSQSKA
jgi:putative oxidoreductase